MYLKFVDTTEDLLFPYSVLMLVDQNIFITYKLYKVNILYTKKYLRNNLSG